MKVQIQGRRVAIESLEKVKKKEGILYEPISSGNTGLIKYLGTDYVGTLEIGQLVCYGDQRQRMKIGGKDLEVMESENIIAVLEEESNVEIQKNQDS